VSKEEGKPAGSPTHNRRAYPTCYRLYLPYPEEEDHTPTYPHTHPGGGPHTHITHIHTHTHTHTYRGYTHIYYYAFEFYGGTHYLGLTVGVKLKQRRRGAEKEGGEPGKEQRKSPTITPPPTYLPTHTEVPTTHITCSPSHHTYTCLPHLLQEERKEKGKSEEARGIPCQGPHTLTYPPLPT